MSKTIDTIPEDIYALFNSGIELDPALLQEFGDACVQHLVRALAKREPDTNLRASAIGETCGRRQWYNSNLPEAREDMEPHNYLKFLYGHLIEELVVVLLKASGHKIEAAQDTVSIDGVDGHPDGIIDGVLCDVKSANSRGMYKFKNNGLENEDPFGYLSQLDFYLAALQDDKRLEKKYDVAFIAIDKELGHIVVDRYARTPEHIKAIKDKVDISKKTITQAKPPVSRIPPVKDGKSGNEALAMKCRYCDFKKTCWSDANNGAGIRTFIYSSGPAFLTKVERVPNVPEVE